MAWEIASVLRCDTCGVAVEVRSAAQTDKTPPFPWKVAASIESLPEGWTAANGKIGCKLHRVSLVSTATAVPSEVGKLLHLVDKQRR